jgi:hypothetical protein
MKLIIEGTRLIDNPCPAEIRKAISQLDARGDGFLILMSDDMNYIQCSRNAKTGFMVEYREGSADDHYGSEKNDLDTETVSTIFSGYVTGDTAWKNGIRWAKLTLAIDETEETQNDGRSPTGKQIAEWHTLLKYFRFVPYFAKGDIDEQLVCTITYRSDADLELILETLDIKLRKIPKNYDKLVFRIPGKEDYENPYGTRIYGIDCTVNFRSKGIICIAVDNGEPWFGGVDGTTVQKALQLENVFKKIAKFMKKGPTNTFS